MKRILSLVITFALIVLSASVSFAEDAIDFSTYSLDELIKIKAELDC